MSSMGVKDFEKKALTDKAIYASVLKWLIFNSFAYEDYRLFLLRNITRERIFFLPSV